MQSELQLPGTRNPTTVSPYTYHDGGLSPVADLGAFQNANVGLSFEPAAARPSLQTSNSYSSFQSIQSDADGISVAPRYRQNSTESDPYFSPPGEDTTPLRNGKQAKTLKIDIPRVPNTNMLGPPTAGSHLGDDLRSDYDGSRRGSNSDLEAGRLSVPRSRSISPNPISRASSMMKMMSQRVVNLSNEQDVVDHSYKRKTSIRHTQRMDEPPPLPSMPSYAHDAPNLDPHSPVPPPEKQETTIQGGRVWRGHKNPLKGKSLGIFAPDNFIRKGLMEVLVHPIIEPFILVLIIVQAVCLAVESAPSVYTHPRDEGWGTRKLDLVILCLFGIYTFEVIARIIVSGFIKNPIEFSTIDRSVGFKQAVADKTKRLFAPHRHPTFGSETTKGGLSQQGTMQFPEEVDYEEEAHMDSRQRSRKRLARRAFLRHSFNRLDFVAVVSFWISFVLTLGHYETLYHIYIFRMLSCLRILRLLGLTTGTSIILRSLKKAAPLLVNVAFLIGFFWLLFAIIGVQSFKSSLRRTCVWFDPQSNDNYTQDFQFCGGYLDNVTGQAMPWITANGVNGSSTHKGYLCPMNSKCIEGSNPYGGTVSYDNVLQAIELVFVIMTSNTFSDLLYYNTDSDYLASAIYYAAGIVIMTFWLMNLLIAVITSSFQVIREEGKGSAFTGQEIDAMPVEEETQRRPGFIKRFYDKTYWLWVGIIIFDLITMALTSSTMGSGRQWFISTTETLVTGLLAIEIILRFCSDRRNFFKSYHNWVDLGLAVITGCMQIPLIHDSGEVYAWMTFFQIIRVYRVILAFSVTRDLIMVVFGNISGLLNLILFVFLLTFLAAVLASQLFRGEIPPSDDDGTIETTFSNMYNSFLGMYIILSSENWTTILYAITQYEYAFSTAWIGATFCIMWYILSNFIVLNMFIAVIQESFDVSEDEKRVHQVKAFLHQKELGGSSQGNLSLSTIFKFGRDRGKRDGLDYGPATMEMLLKDAVVKEFLDDEGQRPQEMEGDADVIIEDVEETTVQPGVLSALWSKISGGKDKEPNPFYSKLKFSRAYEDLDPRTMAKEIVNATEERKRAQRQYLLRHPKYNVSLLIFKPNNPIRKLCQKIVGPGRGSHRIEGVEPYKPVWYAFTAFVYLAIVAMVLLACVTTPLYQKEYFEGTQYSVYNWFVFADIGFAALFTVEALIKVIADGFFWTPNAYFRGSWGFIDGVVLITLWINIATSLFNDASVSRAIGAFKALRALRLLNVSDSARDTFHSVIIRGGWKVVSAAFVSISLLIPFAIYGLILFNGQLVACNDGNYPYTNVDACVDEYLSTPYNWDVLSPRVAANSWYSFDDFASSLFILFQIVSQEGWTQVMMDCMAAVGQNLQPVDFNRPGNGIFFVIFNLLGAVFVLTLFVSVFMRNYTEQTGVAFLTADQRSWLELRKILRQINPSKRSVGKHSPTWQMWCYRIAVKKHGRWQRFVTTMLLLHLALLCLEFYPENVPWDDTRDYLFLLLTMFFILNVFVRLIGLGWGRFSRSSWDVYAALATAGTLVTTLLSLARYNDQIFVQLNKLFLVSLALLLIPRNDSLDQLFKTAAASLTVIGNMLATWFVLYLVFAIAFTQIFGLTRFGSNESGNINFRTVPKALILLFRTSSGEGWNQLMEDFAGLTPPNCVETDDFFTSDCGSENWARFLFISWNILSMYIFVSLFVSLIYESFSYVYQRSNTTALVNREEIRRFKEAWATIDPSGSGWITKEDFPRLLGVSFKIQPALNPTNMTRNSLASSLCESTIKRTPFARFSRIAKSIAASLMLTTRGSSMASILIDWRAAFRKLTSMRSANAVNG